MALAPQLAQPLKGEPKKGSVFEPKYDGIRLIVAKTGDKVSIYTRTFHDQTGKMPDLEKAFANVPFDFVVDGEAVNVTDTVVIEGQQVMVSSFSGTQSVLGSSVDRAARFSPVMSYIVFDCLSAQGKDLTDVPDVVRRGAAELLVDLISTWTDRIHLTPRWNAGTDFHKLLDAVVAAGGEGLMVKNPLSAYYPGKRPTNSWFKAKPVYTADVVITGFSKGEGKYTGQIGAIEFGQYKGGVLVKRSKCSGMTDAQRRNFTDNANSYIGKVVEITYNGFTENGASKQGPTFRFPQFSRIRDDKLPEDCEWDE